MNNWWFTADLHLGHAKIIKHVSRPFKDVNEMNATLINEWNKHVTPQDVIVHIGDFCLGSYAEANQWMAQLNGNKIFVYGNHDHWWKGAKKYAYHKKIGKIVYVYCCHFPYRTWPRSTTNGWNLHGHCHNNLEPLANQYDVGVDHAYADFGKHRPYNISDLNKLIKPWEDENGRAYIPNKD
jgi:calcineurin-like phosphoesterase family protein